MNTKLLLLAGVIFVSLVASWTPPALALPPDCSLNRCRTYPNLICACPGTPYVTFCSDWLTSGCSH